MAEFKDNIPIYIQLMEDMKLKMIKGEYKPNEQVPSVRDLAIEYGVNPNTVQKALSELEREGIMKSERTAGRFVSIDQDSIEHLKKSKADDLTKKFINEMKNLGYNQEQINNQLATYKENTNNE